MSPLLFSLSSKKAENQHFDKKDFNYCTILTFFVWVYCEAHKSTAGSTPSFICDAMEFLHWLVS